MYKQADRQYRNIKGVRYELYVFDVKGESQGLYENTLQGAKDYSNNLGLSFENIKIIKDTKWNIYSIYKKV